MNCFKHLRGRPVTVVIIMSLIFLSPLLALPAHAGKYDGVTINIMTFTGPQIAEPLQRRAPEFKKLTGATVNVITVPFSDLYTKLLTDWATGTNSIDAAVFAPQWMADYVGPGYLEDISTRIAKDKALEQDDIGEKESESYFLPIPMLFGATQIKPINWINLDLEGRGIAYKENHYVSLIARLKIFPFGPLFVAGGYRYDSVKIDYQDVDVDAEFRGPFAEVGIDF